MKTILLKKGKQEEIKNSYSAGKLFIDTLKTVLRDKMESSWKSSINDFDLKMSIKNNLYIYI